MSELIKNKRKIQYNLIILLILIVVLIGLVIGATPTFKNNTYGIVLLLLFIIEIPIILNISISGINSIDEAIDNEDHNQTLSSDEMEKMEGEIDEKVQEAEDLTINFNKLSDDIGKYTNWKEFGTSLLIAISKQLEIVTGLVYSLDLDSMKYKSVASYAYYSENPIPEFMEGEGLIGQVVKDKKALFIEEIPEGYVNVISGLGNHNPKYLAIIPIIENENVVGVVEIATFKSIEQGLSRRIFEFSEFLGKKANTIDDNNKI